MKDKLIGFACGVLVSTGAYFLYSLYLRLVVLEASIQMLGKLLASLGEAMVH